MGVERSLRAWARAQFLGEQRGRHFLAGRRYVVLVDCASGMDVLRVCAGGLDVSQSPEKTCLDMDGMRACVLGWRVFCFFVVVRAYIFLFGLAVRDGSCVVVAGLVRGLSGLCLRSAFRRGETGSLRESRKDVVGVVRRTLGCRFRGGFDCVVGGGMDCVLDFCRGFSGAFRASRRLAGVVSQAQREDQELGEPHSRTWRTAGSRGWICRCVLGCVGFFEGCSGVACGARLSLRHTMDTCRAEIFGRAVNAADGRFRMVETRNGSCTGKRRVTILGASGSVGRQALSLMAAGRDHLQLEALVAGRSVETVAFWAKALQARFVAVADSCVGEDLKLALSGSGIDSGAGFQAVREAAQRSCDVSIAAISGFAGLAPTLASLGHARVLALANKESIVCAGRILLRRALLLGTEVVPLDSEHYGLARLLENVRKERVSGLGITASGGPFLHATRKQLQEATPEQALCHPVWRMGAKITVDSATLMNKGLEVIEAVHLFGFPEDRIDVVIHPECRLHAWVSFVCGDVFSHFSTPDMRIPLSACLSGREAGSRRLHESVGVSSLRFDRLRELTFLQPDHQRFPALRLAREVARTGGGAAIVLNAANEAAVRAFLEKRISFLSIASWVSEGLEKFAPPEPTTLQEITDIHEEVVAYFSDKSSGGFASSF